MTEPTVNSPSENQVVVINEEYARAIYEAIKVSPDLPVAWPNSEVQIDFRNWKRDGQRSRVFRVPNRLLRFRPENGRIRAETSSIPGQLRGDTEEDQRTIERILGDQDPQKNVDLKGLIGRDGQTEPLIITADGLVIDGNRRLRLIRELQSETSDGSYRDVYAAILPGNTLLEGDRVTSLLDPRYSDRRYVGNYFFDTRAPNSREILELERKYQLTTDGKSEYSELNTVMTWKHNIDNGATINDLVNDEAYEGLSDAQKAKKKTTRKNFIEQRLRTLNLANEYLIAIERPDLFKLIEGNWQAFIDAQKQLDKLKDPTTQSQFGVSEDQLGLVTSAMFSIIRSNPDGATHIHIRKVAGTGAQGILRNEEARTVFFNIPDQVSLIDPEIETVYNEELSNNPAGAVEVAEKRYRAKHSGTSTTMLKRIARVTSTANSETDMWSRIKEVHSIVCTLGIEPGKVSYEHAHDAYKKLKEISDAMIFILRAADSRRQP